MKKIIFYLCILIASIACWLGLSYINSGEGAVISDISDIYKSDFSNAEFISRTNFTRENRFIYSLKNPSQQQLASIYKHSIELPDSGNEISELEVNGIKSLLKSEHFDMSGISRQSIYVDYNKLLGYNIYWVIGDQRLWILIQGW